MSTSHASSTISRKASTAAIAVALSCLLTLAVLVFASPVKADGRDPLPTPASSDDRKNSSSA